MNSYEYITKEFIILKGSTHNLDEKLNELGRLGWEAYHISEQDCSVNRFMLGFNHLLRRTKYTVRLKRLKNFI